MTISGVGVDGNLIRGNFGSRETGLDTDNPLIEAADTQSAASNVLNLRPKLGKLSEGNDPFKELATRLTDFFSKESENHQAQEIKSACWNDLTDDKKPVFEPTFENLTGAKFSKNPEGGLTITLSPDHVNQGYLQVLSDLTLVAEVIKKSISRGETEHSIGFTSNPIENIKIISHPERNLVIPASKITKNLNYQIGPEFKFIESGTYGLIPVASGMFNLDDVQKGKLKTRNNNNNSKLEQFAFNGSATNTLAHVADLRKMYFTPYNTMFVSPMNESHRAYRIIQDGFEYREPTEQFEEIIKNHNSGPIYDHMITPAISCSTEASPLDASYTGAVREMGLLQKKDKDSETFIHGNPDIFTNKDLSELTKVDSLKLLTHGVNLTYPDGNTILPKYAFSSPGLAERIEKII
jgi:hypothetical protein